MTTPADDLAMIVLTRTEYNVLRSVLSATNAVASAFAATGTGTYATWDSAFAKVQAAHRYERPLAEASTDELLGEVARRIGSPRESETEPSPAPAIPLQESTSEPAPESPEPQDAPAPEPEGEDNGLTAREVTARYRGELAGISDEKGWAEMEPDALGKKVATLRDLLASGIPEDIPITSTPDVLALYGVDYDEMVGACRMPTRVEVRPESVDKRYAVLAFFRGDMQVIVGFRFPRHPGVMAVYLGSMLQNDTHHVEHTGGGGSKAGARGQNSLPTTPKQLVNRLKASGCSVELDPSHTDGITYKVIFRGEELGLVKTDRQPRAQVQSDYNRFLRRMQAVDRQKESA